MGKQHWFGGGLPKFLSGAHCLVPPEYISAVNHNASVYEKLSSSMQRFAQHQRRTEGGTASSMQSQEALSHNLSAPLSWSARALLMRDQRACPLPPLDPQSAAAYDPETVLVGSKLLMDMEKVRQPPPTSHREGGQTGNRPRPTPAPHPLESHHPTPVSSTINWPFPFFPPQLQAGIHLQEAKRLRMQELMNLNQHFGMAFNQALVSCLKDRLGFWAGREWGAEHSHSLGGKKRTCARLLTPQADPSQLGSVRIALPSQRRGSSGGFLARLRGQGNASTTLQEVSVPLDSQTMNHVLVTEPDEGVRKKVRVGPPRVTLFWFTQCMASSPSIASLIASAWKVPPPSWSSSSGVPRR